MQNLMKTIIAGVLVALIDCPQAFGADSGSCGTNCQYTYDPDTFTLTYTGTGANGTGIISISNDSYGLSGSVDNVIVSEGITEIKKCSNCNKYTITGLGSATGKLILPSTLKNAAKWGMGNLGFGTVEINSQNINFQNESLIFKNGVSADIILSENSNFNMNSATFWMAGWHYPSSLNISCKGNPDKCLEKFGTSLNGMTGTVTTSYYSETDSDGNLIQYNDTGYTKSDKSGNIIAKYDFTGNLLAKYNYNPDGSVATYDANGKLIGLRGKRIYTIDEATSLAQKNKNTFTLKYR